MLYLSTIIETVESYDMKSLLSQNILQMVLLFPLGGIFEKSWTVRNEGNIVWKNRYLKCVEYAEGSFFPIEKKIKIPRVYPGDEITFTVKYIAKVEGDYRSRWKMCDKQGRYIYPQKKIGVGLNIHVRDTNSLYGEVENTTVL